MWYLQLPAGMRFQILAPLVQRQKGEFRDLFGDLLKQGFLRARVDGVNVSLSDDLKLDRQMKHSIEVVVDRLVAGKTSRTRLSESVETALRLAGGKLIVSEDTGERAASKPAEPVRGNDDSPDDMPTEGGDVRASDRLFSSDYACTTCGISYEAPSPQLFSFNSPLGMCLDCNGLGMRHDFRVEDLLTEPSKSIFKGAVGLLGPVSKLGRWRRHLLDGAARAIEQTFSLKEGAFLKTVWEKLPEEIHQAFLYGLGDKQVVYSFRHSGGVWKHTAKFAGFVGELLEDYRKTKNPMRRKQLEKYMQFLPCTTCHGSRLSAQASSYYLASSQPDFLVRRDSGELGGIVGAVRGGRRKPNTPATEPVAKLSLPQVCALSIAAASEFFAGIELDDTRRFIADEVLKEVRGRLGFLLRCGLDYLTLDRTAPTLSGGESQRIRLAGQIGCGLVGVVYILDEPSIGLHPRDNQMLLGSLEDLRDQGNTVIVVEHDEDTMRAADHLVDFGPGPGVRGGRVVAEGTLDAVLKSVESVTGQYLSGRKSIAVPPTRRTGNGKSVRIRGATHHNLKNVDVEFPLGKFICITGVSGSGKSSLINDILWPVLNRALNKGEGQAGAHAAVEGIEFLDKAIDIDQSPIGRTPRSNPATYAKLFDTVRELFTLLPESKVRGFKPGRFSFNVAGGRCEACEGHGANKLEMDFLADIWVTCPVCQGRRFNKETLEVRFKGKNIAEVLDMDVQTALEHFENHPKIRAMLQTLHDVGLDYIKLGQASPTLSGGEAQRVKLAKELGKRSTGKTVYILDEPTTGLHFVDIQHLLNVLHGFVDAGNTVIVVEHHLDVLKTADWLIDLGPEGGAGGGRILAACTPEELAIVPESHTGRALLPLLPNVKPPKTLAGKTAKKGAGVPKQHSVAQKTDAKGAAKSSGGSSRWQAAGPLGRNAGADRNIVVRGAMQHNLQKVDVTIPRDAMSVFCGPSGSGKSSLAMDTLYAEGQRRYVESLSSYARQFLGQMPKPRVEHIHGLQPSIAIEQKTVGHTPRSTVGTTTEIYDYFRILYARLGQQYCPDCQIPVETQTADDVIDKVQSLPVQTRCLILAPQEVTVGQQYSKLWERLGEQGYRRVRVDGTTYELDAVPEIDRKRKHNVEIVVDRATIKADGRSRLAESIELAFDLGKGIIRIAVVDDDKPEAKWKITPYSLFRACQKCGESFEELAPHNFSFNSPLGWCASCEGLGVQQGTNLAALISDPTRTILDGAVTAWPDPSSAGLFRTMLVAWASDHSIPLDVPFSQLDPISQRAILYGTEDSLTTVYADADSENVAKPMAKASTKKAKQDKVWFQFAFKGLFPAIEEASRLSFTYRSEFSDLVGEVPCAACSGSRVREDAAAVRLGGKSIKQLCDLPLRDALAFLTDLKLTPSQKRIAGDLLTEATGRLSFLVNVGLHYLTLGRTLPTLSGGESQRIRLAGQLGRALTGVLYVLDEPTIGLHPSDNGKLLEALKRLRDLGNTVILVEHDREVIAAADHLYDFGPGAGRQGGTIVAEGTPRQIEKHADSLTGKYLSNREQITVPLVRRVPAGLMAGSSESVGAARAGWKAFVPPGGAWLELLGARHHNLRSVDLRIPLGTLVAVTGVSGSGKSSLITDTLAKAIAKKMHRAREIPGPHDELLGIEKLSKLIVVDQQPLGNTPSSNPATYTGVFEEIRELFANLPDAKVRGFKPARFSFNRPGGRCEACEGNGQQRIEMHFLPDVWVECDVCRGKRYNQDTLAVKFKGQSISDVLDMPIGQAAELFNSFPKIRGTLVTLSAIGLDYLTLGQSAPTLSGGEAQRVKLAAELTRPQSGSTLYLLDEPTTGLHFDDIRKLLKILHSLVDSGNTVVVVEHNLDVIKTCDWIVDMGPHAGSEGGYIVAEGTPEDVAALAGPVTPGPVKPGPMKVGTKGKVGPKGKGNAAENASGLSVEGSSSAGRPSLTAPILAAVLANSLRANQEVFDAREALKKRAGDLDLRQVGKDAKMPWEADGPKWHLGDHLANNGKTARWDVQILKWVTDAVEADGRFAQINWNSRSVVEVTGPTKAAGWFLHAMTGDEWFLALKFRVRKNTFVERELADEMDLTAIDDLADIPVFGRGQRVRIKSLTEGLQEVTLVVHKLEEVKTKAFSEFLAQAANAFPGLAAADIDDVDEAEKRGKRRLVVRAPVRQLAAWPTRSSILMHSPRGRRWAGSGTLMRKGFLKGKSSVGRPPCWKRLKSRSQTPCPNVSSTGVVKCW